MRFGDVDPYEPTLVINGSAESEVDRQDIERAIRLLIERYSVERSGKGYIERNKNLISDLLIGRDGSLGVTKNKEVENEATYEAISDKYGISRERVRQIAAGFLRSVRHPNNRRLFRSLSETLFGRDLTDRIWKPREPAE